MSKPRLLDLFCGAGGAAMGYHRAGFEVVGVDIAPQKHYPFEFHQADALTFPLDGFDVIHASPPCQGYSVSKGLSNGAPLLINDVRLRLRRSGIPWVIENVGGAVREMPSSITLCGTHFGLRVYRHRLFESSHLLFAPSVCHHPRYLMEGYYCIYGNGARTRQTGNKGNAYSRVRVAAARAAMDIDWMTSHQLSQAIPPAYTEWLGRQLLTVLDAGRRTA